MTSQFHFPFHDMRGQQRTQLRRALNDAACHAHADRSPDRVYYGLHAIAIGLVLALCWRLLGAGFGDPLAAAGWKGLAPVLACAPLIAVMAWLLARCLRRYRLSRRFGFAPGRYVLPFSIIDARTETFVVSDLLQLAELKVVHHTIDGRYVKSSFAFAMQDGAIHTFIVRGRARAERFYQRFYTLQGQTRHAFESRDFDKVRLTDPLFEIRKNRWVLPPREDRAGQSGMLSGLLSRRPSGQRLLLRGLLAERWLERRPWLRQALACALIALLATPAVWALRMEANDEAMYRNAQALNTEAAYQGYLQRGRRHADEMRAALRRMRDDRLDRIGPAEANPKDLNTAYQRHPRAGGDPMCARRGGACKLGSPPARGRRVAVQEQPATIEAAPTQEALPGSAGNE